MRGIPVRCVRSNVGPNGVNEATWFLTLPLSRLPKADATAWTCQYGSQLTGIGSTGLHHMGPLRSHLSLNCPWLKNASSYPNSVPQEGQIVKSTGGSVRPSYPQIGQVCIRIGGLSGTSTESTASVSVVNWQVVEQQNMSLCGRQRSAPQTH